ncbi:hypothetical protein N782_15775 [Pontibacillus yanchengensis Y32]|uniref:Uncharacterized protein n=1 Tax=Pontibacillus yanchengensis Y32 TaxID=1385514 RepID=A0A0A2TBX3_9BACI|nr:hypothetical protein N782_15775 [Pontibacillus yanchengensis Y32]
MLLKGQRIAYTPFLSTVIMTPPPPCSIFLGFVIPHTDGRRKWRKKGQCETPQRGVAERGGLHCPPRKANHFTAVIITNKFQTKNLAPFEKGSKA